MNISLSPVDQMRFGVVTAKAMLEGGESIEAVMDWCRAQHVEFGIFRIPVQSTTLAQDMESSGFFLTDTLIYYRCKTLESVPAILPDGYQYRVATAEDAGLMAQLSETVFRNYIGHYHSDRRLNKADCDQVYASWAANSVTNKNVADVVYLIFSGPELVGFLTIKIRDANTAEIVLNGVHPAHQKLGLYAILIKLAKQWAYENRLTLLIVSTQLNNLSVQRVWCRQGFEPYQSFYTFHKWFTQ
jgi:GNAT superfamily N-acetyltransferase